MATVARASPARASPAPPRTGAENAGSLSSLATKRALVPSKGGIAETGAAACRAPLGLSRDLH